MFVTPIVPRIHAVRCGTCSIVANAGTPISNEPMPNPMKHPSSIRSSIAGFLNVAIPPRTLASGFHVEETFVNASDAPPRKSKKEQTARALPGCCERARVVAITGPRTEAALITAVSIAYAVRRNSAGTTEFHSGLIYKLIGGAMRPKKKDNTNMEVLVCDVLRAMSIPA